MHDTWTSSDSRRFLGGIFRRNWGLSRTRRCRRSPRRRYRGLNHRGWRRWSTCSSSWSPQRSPPARCAAPLLWKCSVALHGPHRSWKHSRFRVRRATLAGWHTYSLQLLCFAHLNSGQCDLDVLNHIKQTHSCQGDKNKLLLQLNESITTMI